MAASRPSVVERLSPVATVDSTAVPGQVGLEGAEGASAVESDPASNGEAGQHARDDGGTATTRDDERELEHERDD